MANKDMKISLTFDAKTGRFTGDVRKLKAELEKVGPSAEKSMKQIEKSSDTAASALKTVARYAAGAFAVGAVVNYGASAVRTADQLNILEQRVKTATKNTGDFDQVFSSLYKTAQQTGTALESNVVLFQSLARVAPEIGATNAQMLTLTKTLQQLGTIGGASQEQMSNAMLQFGQAMAGGVMRAEEFNSIVENTPEIAARIAEGMDMTVGQLRMAVLEGTVLSEDVFESLISQTAEIDKQFGDMAVTVDQATTMFANSIDRAIGAADDSLSFTQQLAKGLQGWSMWLDSINPQMTEHEKINLRIMELRKKINEGASLFGNSTFKILEWQKELKEIEEKRLGIWEQMDEAKAKAKQNAVEDTAAKSIEEENKALDALLDKYISDQEYLDTRYKQTASWRNKQHAEELKQIRELQKAQEKSAKQALQEQQEWNDAVAEDWKWQQDILAARQAELILLERKANTIRFGDAYNAEIDALNEINELYRLGMISYDEWQDALYNAQSDSLGFSDEVIDSNREIEQSYENLLRRIDDGFANLWRDLLSGNANFVEAMKSGAIDIAAEYLHAMTTKPLTDGFASYLSGNNSQSLLSNISSAYSLASNPFLTQGMTAAYGVGFGTANSAISSYMATGQYGAAAQYAAGSYLPVIGGAYYGYQQNGVAGGLASGAGAYYGAQLGTAILPGIGTAIGSILGAIGGNELISGIFGGDWKTKDTGLSLAATLSGVDADYYQYQKKDGGWFSSDKKKTTYTDATEIESSLSDIVALALTNLDANANALGLDLADTFSVTIKESFKGLDESEIQAKVQEMLVDIYTQAAGSIDGLDAIVAPLAASGETAADTLARVINQFDVVDGTLERLGANLGDLDEQGLVAAQNITNLVGGIDAFAQASQIYYQNFYSEQEKLDDLAQNLKDQFAELSLVLPANHEQYRALLESLKEGTVDQQEQAAMLLRLNDVANTYYNTLESRQTELAQSVSTAYNTFENQASKIEKGLIALQGDEALLAYQREQELLAIDPLLKEHQQRLWALEDEQAELERVNAEKAQYNAKLKESETFLGGVNSSIRSFLASLVIGASTVSVAYADTLDAAKAYDRQALSSITSVADQYVQGAADLYSDRGDYMRLQASVAADLNALTSLSPEEFLAAQIADELQAQTSTLSDAITIDLPSALDGKLSLAEQQIGAVIDLALNDVTLSDEIRALLFDTTTSMERSLSLVLDTEGMADATKAMLLDDIIQSTATLNTLLAEDTPESLLNLVMQGELAAQSVIDAVLADGVVTEVENLLLGKTIDASSVIDATLNSAIDPSLKALIVEDQKDYTARILAMMDEATPDNIDALLADGDFNATATIDADLSDASEAVALSLLDGTAFTVSALVDAVLAADIDPAIQSIIRDEQKDYTASISAVLNAGLSDSHAVALMDAEDALYKSAVLSATMQNALTEDQWAVIDAESETIRKILEAVGTGDLSDDQRAVLGESTEIIEKTLNLLNAGTLTATHLAMLYARDDEINKLLEIGSTGSISSEAKDILKEGDEVINKDVNLDVDVNSTGTLSPEAQVLLEEESETINKVLAILNSGALAADQLKILDESTETIAKTLALISSGSLSSTHLEMLDAQSEQINKLLAISSSGALSTDAQQILDEQDETINKDVNLAVEVTNTGTLSEEAKALLEEQSETIVKTLTASGGLLTDDQRAILDVISGAVAAELGVDVALGDTAGGALSDLQATVDSAQNKLKVSGMTDLIDAIGDDGKGLINAVKSLEDAMVVDISLTTPELAGTDPLTQYYANTVAQAYAGIGRSGFGNADEQIDVEGWNYWMNQLQTGNVTLANFEDTFLAAVQAYPGYSVGGMTPDIGLDTIAGVVHGGEYVAPSWQLQKYPDLFATLENDRVKGFKTGGPVDFSFGRFSGGNGMDRMEKSIDKIVDRLDRLLAKAEDEESLYLLKDLSDTVVRWNTSGLPDTRELGGGL